MIAPLLPLALALVALAPRGSVEPEPSRFAYAVGAETIPLRLDPERVVVFQAGGNEHTIAGTLRSSPRAAALSTVRVEAWSGADGAVLVVPPAARSEAGVRDLVAALAETHGIDFASPLLLDPRGHPVVLSPGVFVAFHETIPTALREGLVEGLGTVTERDAMHMPDVWWLERHTRDGFELLAATQALHARPEVRFAEPNYVLTGEAHHVPDDARFGEQWGLHNVGQSGGLNDADVDAVEVWDITRGSAEVVVAIFDDGVEPTHPDLNQLPGLDFTGQGTAGAPANECDRHGTAVMGCVSEIMDNAMGGAGLAPRCKGISIKFFNSFTPCNGLGSFSTAAIAEGIAYCLENGIRIANISYFLTPSNAVTNAFNNARNQGLLTFASTGNSGAASISFPSSVSGIVAVGAANRFGQRAGFSQFGAGLDLLAPGEAILTTDRSGLAGFVPGRFVVANGTSYASPYAAATAALMLSAAGDLSPDEIEDTLQATCVDLGAPGHDSVTGWGLVNAHAAVREALRDERRRTEVRSPLSAVIRIEPIAVLAPLSPGTARTLAIAGRGFTRTTSVEFDGVPLAAQHYAVIDDGRIEIAPPELSIGFHQLTLRDGGRTGSTAFQVAPPATPLLQVGTGDELNAIASADGLDLTVAGVPGHQQWVVFSNVASPSVALPLVSLEIGASFSVLELASSFVIPSEGWTTQHFPLPPALVVLFFQSFTLDAGSPIPVSNLQSMVLTI